MKESKGVYVTKHNIKEDQLNRNYQLYTSKITRDYRYQTSTRDAGVQYNYRRDNVICTCRNISGLRRHQEVRYFSGLPKQIYAYHGSRSFTDIGVGSVKAFQRKKVKRIYLPETDDRGVGSSDLSSFISRRTRYYRSSFYDHKKTSSKCVGGVIEGNTDVLNEKLSPIVHTKSGTTSPSIPSVEEKKNVEIGSNTHEKSFVTTSTQIQDGDVQKEEDTKEVIEVIVEQNQTKDISTKSTKEKKSKEGIATSTEEPHAKRISKRAQEAERVFSSDSLVQHVHDLEHPSEDKQASPMFIDPMENKLEREYRKMFSTKSKESKEQKPSTDEKPEAEMKSTSVLRRRFEALRRGLAKKEDSKKNAVLANKDSSNVSAPSHRDVSIASDPPSLEARSYSNTKVYSPFQNADQDKASTSKMYKKSFIGRKDWTRPEDYDSECQGVKGMFKLWGKKFNLDDEDSSPGPSMDVSKKPKDKIPATESESKKEGKKFFFFKKKSKDKTKQPYKQKKGVTAGRCEVGDGLMIKIGAANSSPAEKERKKEIKQIPENYEEMLRKAWLQQFLAQTIDSRPSVKIRWNNSAYATSSSTVFEIMENVYKDTGVVFRSKSEVTTGESSYYKSFTKQHVNFVQDIEAWMIPKFIPDKSTPVRIGKDEKGDKKDNIEVRISDQKWFIDKSKAFAQKIEVVLHSKNLVPHQKDPSSEYLRIDIPKGFFTDSSSDSTGPMHTSNEEVYKIVEYESPDASNNFLRRNRNIEVGDHLSKDIKVTVSVKDSKEFESNILETVIKRPPIHRDVVIQGSNVYIPKRCNVIGVGIITQKDITRMRKPILKIQDDYSEEDSDHTINHTHNKSKFAESYLQEYYRHWTPLGIDFFSWCVSDSHLQCCSENSHTTVNNQGDGSKSCPNIYDDYQASTVISSCGTSCCSHCGPWEEEPKREDLMTKFFSKFRSKCKSEPPNIGSAKRILPKDSLEVFKRRKIYAASNKSNWVCSDDRPYSIPSIESKGAQDTLTDCPKLKKTCYKPPESKPKKKVCRKHVSLQDCDTMNESLAEQLADKCPPGILSFKGASKCDVCNKKGGVCPKHPKVIPAPTCAIPPPNQPCKEPPKKPPCPSPPMSPCPSPPKSPCPSPPRSPCPSPPKPRCPTPPKPQCPSPPMSPCPSPPPTPPCGSPKRSEVRIASPCVPSPPCMPSPPCPPRKPARCGSPCSPPIPPCKQKSPPCTPHMSKRKPLPCSPPPCSTPKRRSCPPSPPCLAPKKKSCPPSPPTCPPSPPPCPPSPPPCPTPKRRPCPSPPPCQTPKKKPCPHSPPRCPPSPPPCPTPKRKPCPHSPPVCPPSPPPCPSPPKKKPCPHSPPCPPSPPPCPTPPKKKPCPHSPPCPPTPPPCHTPKRKPCPHSPPPTPPPCPTPRRKPCPPLPPKCPPSPPSCPSTPPSCPPTPPPCPSPPKRKTSPPCQTSPPPCKGKVMPGPKSQCKKASPSPSCRNAPKNKKKKSRSPSPCSPPPTPPYQYDPCPPRPPPPPPCPPKPKPPSRCDTPPCTPPPPPLPPCPPPPPPPRPLCDACKKCPSQEFPWPLKNQVSNQSLVSGNISLVSTCSETPSVRPPSPPCPEPKIALVPPVEVAKCKKGCSFLPPECPKPKPCPPPPCKSPPRVSGIFLKMKASKKVCSKECSAWESPPQCPEKNNSEDDITINIKHGTASTEEIREGYNIKVQDEDGRTLYERCDYQKKRPSILNDVYKSNLHHHVSTSIVQNMAMEEKSNTDLQEAKSETSVANLIEINFKLKVTQGDKTTEINIGNDNIPEKPKINTNDQIGQTSHEVFMLKDQAEQCTEEANDKNDINIKIVIKNYKQKKKSDKKYNTEVEEFTQKISEKFQTVSTGYSDLAPEDSEQKEKVAHIEENAENVYSVHRTTINLNSSNEVSKTQMASHENVSEEYIAREPIDLMASSRSATGKSGTEHSESKIEDAPSRKGSQGENIERNSKDRPSARYSMTDTDDQEVAADLGNISDFNSAEMLAESLTKEEKKKLLKKVFEKASKSRKMKNKEKLKQLREMLKVILTSDSSEHEDMAVTSNDLVKEMTYASLKPNYFRDTDSMNNYYKIDSSVISSAKESHTRPNLNYPTENISQCSVRESEGASSDDDKEKQGCLCSTLAARLNMCKTNDVSGVCCCKKPTKIDEETCCDLRTEEDFFLLNYKTIEYIDVETQNSKFICSSKNFSVHSRAISGSIRNCIDVKTVRDSDICSQKVKKTFSPHASHIRPCEMKKLNRNTMLGLTDEDKVYLLNAKPTKLSIRHNVSKVSQERSHGKHRKKFLGKFERPADILQCYETKKAVLEIYAEKTLSDEGEHLVAKLPKFVINKESELEKNYEEYAESYRDMHRNYVTSVNR